MSNSKLINCKILSPNHSGRRTHKIDTITIHCVVGQLTARGICNCFKSRAVEASCNYAVGKDGSIGLCVEEKNRSWCSSNEANDQRAITIEVASDTYAPYAITPAAYEALIKLLVDICKRNGIKKLLWKGDKSLIGKVDKQNMTVHRWFANKACPGDYIYNRLGKIANEVNENLGVKSVPTTNTPKSSNLYKVNCNALNIRKGPGTNYAITGCIRDRGIYTIVETKNGWGRLKSGAGWIYLAYCKKK